MAQALRRAHQPRLKRKSQADSAFRIRCAAQSVVADRRSLANRIRCTHACRTPNPHHSSAQHIRPQPWPTQVSVLHRLLKSVAATRQTDRRRIAWAELCAHMCSTR